MLEKEAWIRFFLALGGLTLAFAAAVFSTVSVRAGNLWATAILASAALLLAGVVAVTTVPYLARRVALANVREALDYDITREGAVYLVLALIIGIAGLNTGNNLLFIVLSAMLAAILVSGVASAGVLRRLELEIGLPQHVFAGRSVMTRLTLRNRRRRLPSFSVSVVPPRPRQGKRLKVERTIFGFPGKRPPYEQWIRVPDIALKVVRNAQPGAQILSTRVYFPYLPARTDVTADVELHFARRGRYVQDGFGLATRFPFSFLVKTRRVALAREVIVYPSVEPTDAFFEVLPMITGEFEAFVRGRGYDLYRIREYMPEDSARHVDWKATAKTGALKVREFTREDERKLRIVFDNPAPGTVTTESYERAVALAASLGWHFAGEDAEVSFAAPGYGGATDVYEFLRFLALVEPRAGESILEKLEVSEDYNVILTSRPRGSIPTQLWACSYFIFIENGK
jgi:uncharacterized protein (DUF58 family)